MSGKIRKWSEKMSEDKQKSMMWALTEKMEKMLTLKRKGVDLNIHESCLQAKCSVTINTVNKWIAENGKKLSTTTWLCYDKANRDSVSALKCSVCIRL